MTGTLDSDCKVFTEDLEFLTNGKLSQRHGPLHGLFVLFCVQLFTSAIIREPFAFNEYSSMIFMPLMVMSMIECVRIIREQK